MGDSEQALENLRRYYDEHLSQAQKHESLRAQGTSILSAISAGVVAIAGVGGLDRSDIPAGVLVVFVASLGVLLSLKHYERYRFHAQVLDRVRQETNKLDSAHPLATPDEILEQVGTAHYRDWSLARERTAYRQHKSGTTSRLAVSSLRLHLLWALVPASIGLSGALLTILAMFEV